MDENKIGREVEIYNLCHTFAAIWQAYRPQLRFMQVICNFQTYSRSDLFYLADKDLIQAFEDYCKSL